MKIAIIGYGKMGKMVEQSANLKGHSIVSIIGPSSPHTRITKSSLANAEVCIDFSHPNCALDNIKNVSDLGINMVVGTTGWYENIDTAKNFIDKSQIGFIYSPNFSLGIALFLKIAAHTASLISPFSEYDIAGIETHHNQKVDSPSGTAKAIAAHMQSQLPQNHPPIPFSSVRVGSVPGTHTILIDSPADTITLTHTARNREGFANGAIIAAEWLSEKKGFFTLDDLLRSLYAHH